MKQIIDNEIADLMYFISCIAELLPLVVTAVVLFVFLVGFAQTCSWIGEYAEKVHQQWRYARYVRKKHGLTIDEYHRQYPERRPPKSL
jgi:hypothetical protein